jgi:hypothetical protein
MDTLVITNSRWRYQLLLLVSLCFVGSGVFILRGAKTTAESWTGWIDVLFFGACAAVFVWQLFERRPRLKIDEHGINDRTLGVGLIPWSEITDAYVKSIQSNDFICLTVRDPNRWIGKLSPVGRAMLKANQALGFTELNINLSGTNARTREILELILKLSAASQIIR